MKDINFCRLCFLCGRRAGRMERMHASGRVWGLPAVNRVLADRVRVKLARKVETADCGWARNEAATWSFGETLETGMPASISGIHNGEHQQPPIA
jgi:hypothetical protein